MSIILERYKDVDICVASNGKLYGRKKTKINIRKLWMAEPRMTFSDYLYDDLVDIREAIDNELIEWH